MSFGDKMNIYIIGMPLSGKTTIGKDLAVKLNYNYVDLDDFIESAYNVNINTLFSEGNETYFRMLETKALKEFKEKRNIVIATGGGIVLKTENKDLMNGKVIYLNVDVEVLNQRKAKSYQRPLLQTESLLDLYLKRQEKYEIFADIIVDNENSSQTVQKIIELLIEGD